MLPIIWKIKCTYDTTPLQTVNRFLFYYATPSFLYDLYAPWQICFNTLRPRQNGRLSADDTFKRFFLNENIRISIKISLKFVPEGLINNIPALVLIMVWPRQGDKPLSEPMMVRSLTHICVTRPQWVKCLWCFTCSKDILVPHHVGMIFLVIIQYHHCIIFGLSQWSDPRASLTWSASCIYIYMCVCIYVCMCVCVCIYIYTYVYLSLIKVTDDVCRVYANIDKKWPIN